MIKKGFRGDAGLENTFSNVLPLVNNNTDAIAPCSATWAYLNPVASAFAYRQ